MGEMHESETIIEIKRKLRLAMNGEVSRSMSEKGVHYQMNWGLTIPLLKEIAKCYTEDNGLALVLWEQNVRECRILAAMIQPSSSFSPIMADSWVKSLEYQDLAEICSLYLFRRLPFSSWISFKWIADDDEMVQYCGYLTLAHLFRDKLPIAKDYLDEFKDHAATAIAGKSFLPKQGAGIALDSYERNYG